jgi:hypothetical protein
VEKRSKKIEADMKRLMSEALEKKKAKDTRGKCHLIKRDPNKRHMRNLSDANR